MLSVPQLKVHQLNSNQAVRLSKHATHWQTVIHWKLNGITQEDNWSEMTANTRSTRKRHPNPHWVNHQRLELTICMQAMLVDMSAVLKLTNKEKAQSSSWSAKRPKAVFISLFRFFIFANFFWNILRNFFVLFFLFF